MDRTGNTLRWVLTLTSVTCIALSSLSEVHAQPERLPDPDRTIATNLAGFTVPFKIDNENGAYVEVHLYVSDDRGRSWDYHSKQDVDATGFPFEANGDGEYWFALRTLNRDGQLVPSGKITVPELRILVDSQDPKLSFSVESDAAGRVITTWQIEDTNVDPSTLTISHRAESGGDQSDWIPVNFTSNRQPVLNRYFDRVAWWPITTDERIEVKLEIADSAGNSATAVRAVTIRNTTIQHQNSNSTTIANRHPTSKKPPNVVCENGVCRIVDEPANKTANNTRNGQIQNQPKYMQNRWSKRLAGQNVGFQRKVGSPAENIEPPVPENYVRAENQSVAPPEAQPIHSPHNGSDQSSIAWESNSSSVDNAFAEQSSTLDQNNFQSQQPSKKMLGVNHQKDRFKNVPVVQRNDIVPQTRQFDRQLVESSSAEQGDFVVSQSTAYGRGKPGNQPESTFNQTDNVTQGNPISPNQFVTQQTSQDNSIHHPASYSSNGGRSFTAPPVQNSNVQSLFVKTRRFNLNYDVKAIDHSGVGRVVLWVTEDGGATWRSWLTDPDNTSPFPVDVQQEGIYGFRVVINSKDGITGKPPMSNDPPDVWVQVDLSAPKVALTSAPYGSGPDIGKLVIHWEAYDQFLAERPIKLEYSPTENGPWTTITDRLRNTGSYAWKVPAQVPEEIFMRIQAADQAGNVGHFQSSSPIDISGLVPRGRIYSIEPISN